MKRPIGLPNTPAVLPSSYMLSRWSQLHSGDTFIINEDEIHCLHAVGLHELDEDVACLLLRKLRMAKLLGPFRLPLDVVSMNSIVEFTFGHTEVLRKRVVHPNAVRSAADVSVASATGAGLIGLQVGQSVLWPDEQGIARDLLVISVTNEGGARNIIADAKGA